MEEDEQYNSKSRTCVERSLFSAYGHVLDLMYPDEHEGAEGREGGGSGYDRSGSLLEADEAGGALTAL
jgi:hypothetical protein